MTEDRPVRPCPAGCADLADPLGRIRVLLRQCTPAELGHLKLYVIPQVQREKLGRSPGGQVGTQVVQEG